jgi:hypothetical protein
MLYSAKTPWIGVFPDRGDHERRVPEPVSRTPMPVEDELPILDERLVPADRKIRYSGPRIRIHAVLRGMSARATPYGDDVVPPWYARIRGVKASIQ